MARIGRSHPSFLGMPVFFRNYLEDRLSPHVSPLFTDQKLKYLIEPMWFDMEPGVFLVSSCAAELVDEINEGLCGP